MGNESRIQDGTSRDRGILTHPRTQAAVVLVLVPIILALVGLVYAAGQDDAQQNQIARDVADIKATLKETNPAVLAANIKALSDRLDNQQGQLSAMWQRLAAARISPLNFPRFSSVPSSERFSPRIDGKSFK